MDNLRKGDATVPMTQAVSLSPAFQCDQLGGVSQHYGGREIEVTADERVTERPVCPVQPQLPASLVRPFVNPVMAVRRKPETLAGRLGDRLSQRPNPVEGGNPGLKRTRLLSWAERRGRDAGVVTVWALSFDVDAQWPDLAGCAGGPSAGMRERNERYAPQAGRIKDRPAGGFRKDPHLFPRDAPDVSD
jgi:hypothetical protein